MGSQLLADDVIHGIRARDSSEISLPEVILGKPRSLRRIYHYVLGSLVFKYPLKS